MRFIPHPPFQIAVTALAFCTLMHVGAASVRAQTINAEVLLIKASEKSGTIDASLKNIAALSKAPFTSFKSMQLVAQPNVALSLHKDSDLELPNGRTLRLNVKEKQKDGRYHVALSITKPNAKEKQKDYLPLLQVIAAAGDYFFVVGQAYQDGTMIIGVRITK